MTSPQRRENRDSMRVTEASAVEALRNAMQVLVSAWYERGQELGAWSDSEPVANLSQLVSRALALVSRWTCVQWGCELGWWSNGEDAITERRRAGLQRLAHWETPGVSRGVPNPCHEDLECSSLDATTEQSVWHWVSQACERVRVQDGGFEAIVAAFENALQVVPDVRDGRVALRHGKANTAHTRRRSGSYYTPHRIVELILDQTLERALDEHVASGDGDVSPFWVLDPACGAGLFLVAAAKRITARRLGLTGRATPPAQANQSVTHGSTLHDSTLHDSNPFDASDGTAYAAAFARTVRDNIVGVDTNPLAIEWCRLWLWSCAGDHSLDIASFAPGLRVGNALVGAPRDYWRGAPIEAWKPTAIDDKTEARRAKTRHARALASACLTDEPTSGRKRTLLADGWCAAFLWPKVVAMTVSNEQPPSYDALLAAVESVDTGPTGSASAVVATLDALRRRHEFFHWWLEFPEVFEHGGFDVVVGNPPWIAHAGRASQGLEPHLKHHFLNNYSSFGGYPTTHGLFVERAANLLKVGGRLGFVLPASVSELGGYEAARNAHDRLCDFDADLTDFGEGCFPGVTQPCMGLVSRRREGGRSDGPPGAPWPMVREDLGEVGRALLTRLASLPVFDAHLFGERGIQTDQRIKEHFLAGAKPHGRFTTPVREGADIREFHLGEPTLWADWPAMGRQARPIEEYALVRFVVRQTASFPIAALYDGLPFRNSLLAGFGSEQWPPDVLVALLNSSVVRWHHYMRHRDARQPVLPQVKIGHLRAIPRPVHDNADNKRALAELTRQLSDGETSQRARAELDRLVETMYGLSEEEVALVRAWAESFVGKTRRQAAADVRAEG